MIAATAPDSATPEVEDHLRTLGLQSAQYLGGYLASMLLGFISFPIYTRIFSVAQFGLIDLAQKVVLTLTAGSKMGLQNAALRFYDGPRFSCDRERERVFYSTMSQGILATSVAAAVLFGGQAALFPQSWINAPLSGLTGWIAILVVVRALQSMFCAFLRVEERTKAFNIAALATKALTISFVCALLPLVGKSARTFFTATTCVEAGVVLSLAVWLIRRGLLRPGRFDRDLLRTGILFGLPLVFYESAFGVLGSADRFLVRHYLGANALGLYSVAYGLSQTVNDILITPLNLALMPIYMRLWTSSGREVTMRFLTESVNYYLVAAGAILSVVSVSARDVVVVLSSSKYAGAERFIPLLLAGLLIYTAHVFVAAGLLLQKKTLRMAAILFCCALANVSLNCFFLPRFGLQGGAFATFLSYLLCVGLLWGASLRTLPLSIHTGTLVKSAAAAAGAYLAAVRLPFTTPFLHLIAVAVVSFAAYASILLIITPDLRVQAIRAARYGIRLYDGI